MTDQHPITPPTELLDQWAEEYWGEGNDGIANGEREIATQAARWGADQELKACSEWLYKYQYDQAVVLLLAARRPKPPSRKEQALEAISRLCASVIHDDLKDDAAIIRRALEALPND